MKNKIRKVLMFLSALVFLWSMTMLLHQQWVYREGDKLYAQAQQLATAASDTSQQEIPPPDVSVAPVVSHIPDETNPPDFSQPPVVPVADPLADVELEPLQAASKAVTGWICIPDTKLSYPLVQGKDNAYYLDRAWNGRYSALGSIFLDVRNNAGLTDFHTLIYGHRMKNGSMFGSLKYYNDFSYLAEHPYVYIKTEEGVRQYEIFAAYEAPVRSCTYRLDFPDEAARQELIDFALQQSVIATGVVPETTDRIITLSTCTGQGYDARWVVQAVEVPLGE